MKSNALIVLIVFILISCEGEKAKFDRLYGKITLKVYGVVKFPNNKLILLIPQHEKTEDIIFLLLGNENEIIHFEQKKFNSFLNDPIFFNDKYFITTIRYRKFLVFDSFEEKFIIVDYDSFYVASLIVYNDSIYYSTEKSESCVRRINLINGEVYKYKIAIPNSSFYLYHKKLFIRNSMTEKMYLVDKFKIKPSNMNINISESFFEKRIEDIQVTDDLNFYSKFSSSGKKEE